MPFRAVPSIAWSSIEVERSGLVQANRAAAGDIVEPRDGAAVMRERRLARRQVERPDELALPVGEPGDDLRRR